MTDMNPVALRPPAKSILSLDGGGIRGYSSLLILEKIMESIRDINSPESQDVPRPCEWFDLIGGTSTGGLIAIMLGRLRMSVAQALKAYADLAERAFTPKLHHLPYSTSGRYSATELANAVKSILANPERRLDTEVEFRDAQSPKTVVLAVTKSDVSAGPTLFKTYDNSSALAGIKLWEVARATSAALTFFKSICIGRDKIEYLDAGFGTNNPCQVLLDEAKLVFPGSDLAVIVSIGTGLQDLIEVSDSRKSVLNSLGKMATNSRSIHTHLDNAYPANGPYTRLDVPQGVAKIDLADWRKTSEIAGHTANWLNNASTKRLIKACAQKIVSAREQPAPNPDPPVSDSSSSISPSPRPEMENPPNFPASNDHFIPRDNVFEWLDEKLCCSKSRQAALTGMGGIGKTQLAIHYAHSRKKKWVRVAFWLDGRTENTFKDDCTGMAKWLGLKPDSYSFRKWLRENSGWLLVIDNVTSLPRLQKYLPDGSSGGILYTTRDQKIEGSKEIALQTVIPPDEAQAISLFIVRLVSGYSFNFDETVGSLDKLKARSTAEPLEGRIYEHLRTKHSITDYQQLQNMLGSLSHLPLALSISAAYMRRYDTKLDGYLESIRGRGDLPKLDFFKHLVPHSEYPQSLFDAFEVSYQNIEQQYPEAAQLLTLLGFLDRQSTSVTFLTSVMQDQRYWNESIVATIPDVSKNIVNVLNVDADSRGDEVRRYLGELLSLSLIERISPEGVINIHSLIHDWIHRRMGAEEATLYLQRTVTTLEHRLPPLIYSEYDRSVPSQSSQVLSHVDRIASLAAEYKANLTEKRVIILFLTEASLWYAGEKAMETAVSLLDATITDHDYYLAVLTYGAVIFLALQKNLGDLTDDFSATDFEHKTAVLLRGPPLRVPPCSKAVLTLAELCCRISSIYDLDPGTMMPESLEFHLYCIAQEGVTAFLLKASDFLSREQSSPNHSPKFPGLPIYKTETSGERAHSVDDVGRSVMSYALAYHYRRDYDTSISYLSATMLLASQNASLEIPELRKFFELFVDVAFQKLSRLKDKYIPSFVALLDQIIELPLKPSLLNRKTNVLENLHRHYIHNAQVQSLLQKAAHTPGITLGTWALPINDNPEHKDSKTDPEDHKKVERTPKLEASAPPIGDISSENSNSRRGWDVPKIIPRVLTAGASIPSTGDNAGEHEDPQLGLSSPQIAGSIPTLGYLSATENSHNSIVRIDRNAMPPSMGYLSTLPNTAVGDPQRSPSTKPRSMGYLSSSPDTLTTGAQRDPSPKPPSMGFLSRYLSRSPNPVNTDARRDPDAKPKPMGYASDRQDEVDFEVTLSD